MNYHVIEIDGEDIKFRFKNSDCMEIEKRTGVKMLDYIQDYSITTVTMLLRYARKSFEPNFTMEQAGDLFEKLVENDYTLEDIIFKVIYETAVVSGFLKKSDLEEIMDTKKELKEKKKQEVLQS